MIKDLKVIEKQFEYLRRRGCKGELTLGPFELTNEDVLILREKGYKTKTLTFGFLKKKVMYNITQLEEEKNIK